MGLQSDFYDAYVKTMTTEDRELDDAQKRKIKTLSVDLRNAVIRWMTAQTFTITEMKAILEVEELSTVGPLQADVLPTVQSMVNPGIPTAGSPSAQVTVGPGTAMVSMGTKGVLIPPVSFKKMGGQGGAMMSSGYAYIGPESPQGESNEDLTKVKLLDENIVNR